MYTEAELMSGDMGKIWELTTNRTFALVNTLLQEAGSKERVFRLYSGHDTRAIFLTHEMYEALRPSAVLPQHEMPVPMPVA